MLRAGVITLAFQTEQLPAKRVLPCLSIGGGKSQENPPVLYAVQVLRFGLKIGVCSLLSTPLISFTDRFPPERHDDVDLLAPKGQVSDTSGIQS